MAELREESGFETELHMACGWMKFSLGKFNLPSHWRNKAGVFTLGRLIERCRKSNNVIGGEREVDLWAFILVAKLQKSL